MSFEDTLRMVNGKAGNGKLAELNLNLIFMRTRLFLWPRACSAGGDIRATSQFILARAGIVMLN